MSQGLIWIYSGIHLLKKFMLVSRDDIFTFLLLGLDVLFASL